VAAVLNQILRAARFQREAYVQAVVSPNAVADGLMIVGVVWIVLAAVLVGSFDLLLFVRIALGGLFAWIVLSGVIYLMGKHVFEGYGSFPGTMAMTAIVHPLLVLILVADIFLDGFAVIVVGSVWFLVALVPGSRVALDLKVEHAAIAVGVGYLVWLIFGWR
jgi:hypothetical protein